MEMIYQFFVENPIVAIAFVALVILVAVFLFVRKMQELGLEKIRAIVYKGFVYAENNFLHGANKQKFQYVVQLARSNLPNTFKIFITDKILEDVVQMWFDLIKDILDDGRINSTRQVK